MCRQEARRGGAIVDRLCFFTAFFPLVPPRLNMLMRMTMHHRIDTRVAVRSRVRLLCTALVFGSPNSMIVVRRRGGTLPVVLRRPVR